MYLALEFVKIAEGSYTEIAEEVQLNDAAGEFPIYEI